MSVVPGLGWRRSSACAGNGCVEVTYLDSNVAVRDSKAPGPLLTYTPEEWAAFIAGVKAGEFDDFASGV